MKPDVQIDLSIPDIWFDVYARFLPGLLFVACVYVDKSEPPLKLPGLNALALLTAAGYFCGLVAQPVSSFLTWLFEWAVAPGDKNRRQFAYAIQSRLPKRQSMVLTKMRAETTFFTQMFVLSVVACFALWDPRLLLGAILGIIGRP